MRVTMVCLNYPPEPTGIAVYSGGLAEGLADRGWDVSVVSGLPHYPQWRVQDGFGPGDSEPHDHVRLARRRHPVPSHPRLLNRLVMELGFGLSSVLARWRTPDVVVLVTPALFASFFGAVRAKLQRRPYVVWVQDIYSLGIAETGSGGGVAGRVLRVAERLLLRHAAEVIVIHDRFKASLVRSLGIDADRVTVVRNWSHIDVEERSERDALRQRLGWPKDRWVVLHAGNMGAKQGLMNVVKASQEAEQRGDDVLFVLMGDGNRRAELEAAGGNSRLRIIDPLPREDFLDALRAADVLLVNECSGLSEMAVPSKLTSYFATGRPVIAATDEGSVTAQEIATSEAGLRISPEDPGALVSAALRLREDHGLADRLGANGVRFREQRLTESAALTSFDVLLKATAGLPADTLAEEAAALAPVAVS